MKFAYSSKKMLLVYVLAIGFVLNGCSGESETPGFEYMDHMMDSESVKAQEKGPDGIAMRRPPEGTIPRGFKPYRYANNAAAAAKMKNPLPMTKEVLKRGQHLYDTYCLVCHGRRGEGNGTIVPKFPQPPSLQSKKVRGWTDGQVYHVISVGQNLMPSYASQVDQEDRWAIAHYLRVLHRSLNPTKEDLRLLKEKGY